jgi:hypothetical protein
MTKALGPLNYRDLGLLNLTPQVGLEPTTLRLRFVPRFHAGADYLINFLLKVAGR